MVLQMTLHRLSRDGIGAWITNNGRAEMVRVFHIIPILVILQKMADVYEVLTETTHMVILDPVAEGVDGRNTCNSYC